MCVFLFAPRRNILTPFFKTHRLRFFHVLFICSTFSRNSLSVLCRCWMASIIQGRWLCLYRGPEVSSQLQHSTVGPKSSLFAILWLFFQVKIWTHAPRSWNTTLPTLRASGQRSQTSRQPYNPTVDPWDSFTLLCTFVAVASLEEQHWFVSPPSLLAKEVSSPLPTQGLYLANYCDPQPPGADGSFEAPGARLLSLVLLQGNGTGQVPEESCWVVLISMSLIYTAATVSSATLCCWGSCVTVSSDWSLRGGQGECVREARRLDWITQSPEAVRLSFVLSCNSKHNV